MINLLTLLLLLFGFSDGEKPQKEILENSIENIPTLMLVLSGEHIDYEQEYLPGMTLKDYKIFKKIHKATQEEEIEIPVEPSGYVAPYEGVPTDTANI